MSVVAAALVAAIATIAFAVLAAGSLLVERHRVAAVGDAVALAAADAVAGLGAGPPCDVARRLAEHSHARLLACEPDGTSVTVRVMSAVSSVPVGSTSTAGQPRPAPGPSTEAFEK